MLRFLVVMGLVYGAYSVGEYDADATRPRAHATHLSTMRANDEGIASDVSAIMRDGVSEIGTSAGSRIKGTSAQGGTPDTGALADDIARAASRIARKVAGGIVIRVCPSLGLTCGFPEGT